MATQDHVSRLTISTNYLVFQKTGENGWEGTRKDNLPHDGNVKETKTHTKVRMRTPSKGCKVTHHNQHHTVTCVLRLLITHFSAYRRSLQTVGPSMTHYLRGYSMTHFSANSGTVLSSPIGAVLGYRSRSRKLFVVLGGNKIQVL